MRIFIRITAIFLLLIVALLVAPVFVNLETHQKNITDKINQALHREITFNGDSSLAFLPTPKVTFNNVFLANIEGSSTAHILEAKKVEIKLNIWSLMTGNINIDTITLFNPDVTLETLADGQKNWLTGKEENVLTYAKTLHIKNGTLTYLNKQDRTTYKADNIELSIQGLSLQEAMDLEGQLTIAKNTIEFSAKIDEQQGNQAKTTATLFSDAFSFNFEGITKNLLTAPSFAGTMKGEGKNISHFLAKHFFREENATPKHSKFQDNFNITAAISLSKNNIDITDFNINSVPIQSKGEFHWLRSKDITSDITLVFDILDLDRLAYTKPEVVHIEDIYKEEFNLIRDFEFTIPKNITGLFELSIKELIYKEQSVKQLYMSADWFNDVIIVHPFVANLPGDSYLSLKGSLSHNGIRPKFLGEFNVSGKNLRQLVEWSNGNLSSLNAEKFNKYRGTGDIQIIPNQLSISGVEGVIDQSAVSGGVKIHLEDTRPKVDIVLNIEQLNLNEYLLEKNPISFLVKTAAEVLENKSERHALQNYIWLRTARANWMLHLNLKSLLVDTHLFKNIFTIAHMNPSVLEIKELSVESDPITVEGNAFLNVAGVQPHLNLNLKSNILDTDYLTNIINSDNSEKEKQTAKEEKQVPGRSWSTKPFHFYGIENYQGEMNFDIGKFIYRGYELKNFKTVVVLRRGLHFSDLSADLLGGKINGLGVLNITNLPTLNVSFEGEHLDINTILSEAIELDSVNGFINISGNISTTGFNPHDWISRLQGGLTYAASDIKAEGINYNYIIEETPKLRSSSGLSKIEKQALLGGKVDFSKVNGNLAIASGVAQTRDTYLIGEKTTNRLIGSIDVPSLASNFLITTAFVAPEGNTLQFNLRLKGTIDNNLEKTLDTRQMEKYTNR